VTALILSFFAGTLSVLSPCVLPLLPVVVASALHRHAHGPLALAAGMVASSTAVGIFFASFGFAFGLDRDVARSASAVVMASVGVILLVPRLQERFQETSGRVLAPIIDGATALSARLPAGVLGQFVLGVLLGAVWTPCTGPTLAAAVTLAARGESLARAGAVMLVFSVGAVVPILIVAYGSRRAVANRSRALGTFANVGKPAMGAALVVIGLLTVTRADKIVEGWMVDHMPEWLLNVTTRF
jgi:cytochrome c biogenesis protein CcdA